MRACVRASATVELAFGFSVSGSGSPNLKPVCACARRYPTWAPDVPISGWGGQGGTIGFFLSFCSSEPTSRAALLGFCLSCPQLYILLRCCPNCPPPPPPPTFLDPGPEPAGGYHDNDFGCVCLSVCVRVCRVFVLHVYVGFLGVCLVSVCVCLCPLGVPWPVFLFCVAPLFSVFLLFFKKKMCRDVVRKSGLYLLSYA